MLTNLTAKRYHRQTINMLVYGIRCTPSDIPEEVLQHYNTEHNLLVFPAYTRPTLISTTGPITERFVYELKATFRNTISTFEREHPYITEEEADILRTIKESNPLATTDWFYMP